MTDEEVDVAVACQGGGSHTAFTAGVLRKLMRNMPPRYNVVGFSGASGGAACATLAWYGHVHPDLDPGELLSGFWRDMSASTPLHRAANSLIKFGIELQRAGVTVPDVNPAYSPASRWGEQEFRRVLESHVDFDEARDLLDGSEPALFISAIDVCSGKFRIFREDELSCDAVMASAAEPHIFEAVEIDGSYYWDGLFAKNPPLKDFMDADDVPDPDEIWLVKINPQERPEPPKSMEGIHNRRNELSGNLSLNAEVEFIERVNTWVENDYLPERYTYTDVRRIRFPKSKRIDWRTKLDRDPEMMKEFVEQGEGQAKEFLDSLEST